MNDPKNLWRNQQTEQTGISLTELRKKLRMLHQRLRLQTGITIAIGLFTLGLFVRILWNTKTSLDRLGWGIVIIGSLCALVPFIYQNYKTILRGSLSRNAGMTNCLDFYREILEGQSGSDYFGLSRRLRRTALILMFGGLFVLLIQPVRVFYRLLQQGSADIRPWIPFLLILALWVVAAIVIGRRRRFWLRREFRALRALEKENR